MTKNDEFSKACTEVYEFLKYCPKEMIKKIPVETLTMIYSLKDDNIIVEIDQNKPVYAQNISDVAISVILEIAYKYWYSTEERQLLEIELDKGTL